MRCFRFLLGAATLLLSVSAQVDPPPGYNAALETNDGVAKAEQPDAVRPAAERRAMGGAVLRRRFCDPNRLPVVCSSETPRRRLK